MSARSSSFPSTALVTGSAGGIGRALVERLEEEGADVLELDLLTGFDVSDPTAWQSVDRVELACLNAGVTTDTSDIAALTAEQYRRVVAVNVDGVVYGVRRLARVMENGDAIVVTASLAGLTGVPSDPIYALTKHAVVGFVRSVAPQLVERGIRINAVCPGFANTAMVASELRGSLEGAGFPLLSADEVAEAVLVAARSEGTGEAWIVQPGRDPEPYRFRGVPGPRVAGADSVPPPL
jgi:NAD(P)-dependent dehydrogenase (short-subunit alcohol dehydrogenase family)